MNIEVIKLIVAGNHLSKLLDHEITCRRQQSDKSLEIKKVKEEWKRCVEHYCRSHNVPNLIYQNKLVEVKNDKS